MVNKCAAFGCKTGYVSEKTADGNVENDEKNHVATFHFPFKNPERLDKWMKFINRRDWIPSSTAVLCKKHFEEEYISRGKKCNLKWTQVSRTFLNQSELTWNYMYSCSITEIMFLSHLC